MSDEAKAGATAAMGATVEIKRSSEVGRITGLATFARQQPQAFVEYRAADGCARAEWFYLDEVRLAARAEPAQQEVGE